MTREQLEETLTAYGPRATRATLIVLGALIAAFMNVRGAQAR